MSLTRLLSTFAACALLLSLAGCAASAPEGATVDPAGGVSQSPPAPGVAQGDTPDASGLIKFDPNFPSDASEAQFLEDEARLGSESRSIVRSASVELTVQSVQSAVEDAARIASEIGGSVASQTISDAGSSHPSAQLTLRVPTDRLDDAISELGALGSVRSEHRSADDLTEVHVDLSARVKALETSVARLTALMEGATTTSELIEAESALSTRQQALDGLRAQLQSLEGQIDEASVWVSLQETNAFPGGPRGFWDAVLTGISSIGAFFAGAVIALGVALPWLLLLAVIGLAIFIPVRARKRRARDAQLAEKALSAEPTDSVANARDL